MLKYEGTKEFEIKKSDFPPKLSRDFVLVFSDNDLPIESIENIEETLNNYNFQLEEEEVEIEIIHNEDINKTIITMTLYCPLMSLGSINDEQLSSFTERHKENFKEYYNKIRPY